MFTAATLTGIVSFLGGDLLMLLAGKLAPAGAVKAGTALVRVMKIIDAHAEHLPPGAVRQIQEEARAAGNAAHVSVYGRNVPTGYGL